MKPTLETASIVIPTYNRRELLERTLQSILAMRDVERCQIIVSDDGSSDGTREAVASYSNRMDIVYRFQEDLGFRAARARNAALDLAKHPLLIFLDCGMLVTSSFLHGHLAAHRHEQRAAAVIGYAYGFDRNNENGNRVQQLLDWEDIDASVRRLQKACLTPDPREELYGMVSLPRFGGHPERDYSCGSSANAAEKNTSRFIQKRCRPSRDGARFEDCR